ncbi:MAG: hypothetical protein WBA97_25525 [Actinophytocola sp.]|uniref:hypothetical protein n=1 Tax=Actinophytocola sp. TaxID=1872138 RepID=UPI003C782A44
MTGSEIDREQRYLTALYAYLDELRTEAVTRVDAEDEDTSAIWRAEVTRLAAVEDGLCFGRLDMLDGRTLYIGRLGGWPGAC